MTGSPGPSRDGHFSSLAKNVYLTCYIYTQHSRHVVFSSLAKNVYLTCYILSILVMWFFCALYYCI